MPPATERPALLLDRAVAGYDDSVVLHGISAQLLPGQAIGLLGPNGSGKSTLLKLVLGLLEPLGGRVEVLGSLPSRLDRRRHQIGYVPQVRDIDRAFPASVFDLAMMGRAGRLGLFRRPSGRDRELVSDALTRVGLHDLSGRPFGTLSGGQQQRAFLARALAQESDLLVLDEPAAGVDDENRERIGELLGELRAQGLPMLIATHDIDELHPLQLDAYWCLARGELRVETAETLGTHDLQGSSGRVPVSAPVRGLHGLDRRPSTAS